MQTMREVEASVAPRLVARAPAIGERVRFWASRPEVRAAFVATVALRLVTSGFAGLIVATLNGLYVHAVSTVNATGTQLGIYTVPAPLAGPAAYVTGPWMRWDANYYTSIAERGYTFSGISPFLPLYPALIRLASLAMGGHTVAAALAVSTTATFIAFVCLYQLVVRLTASEDVARLALLVVCLLPTAFFLMAPYTEAVFLALSLATILCTLDRRWGLAVVFAVLASLTRQQGVLLAVLAVPELWSALRHTWSQHASVRQHLQDIWRHTWRPGGFAIAPLAAYGLWVMLLVYALHMPSPAQSLTSSTQGWGQQFTVPGIGVLVDLIFLIARPGYVLLHHIDYALDAISAIVAAVGLIVARRRLPAGLLLYLALCWCVALTKVTESGTTNSASRYLLALLPLCFVPAMWLVKARPPVRVVWFTACALLGVWVFLDWMLWSWIA
jgi:hypothetical protein